MQTNIRQEFPRREFKRSKLPHQITGYAVGVMIATYLAQTMVANLPPTWSVSPVVHFTAWGAMVGGCLVGLSKLLKSIDFEKPVMTVEPGTVTFDQRGYAKMLPWNSIVKIKFHEHGQFRQQKMLVFHLIDGRTERFDFIRVAGISARQLFDTIRRYHRQFGPKLVESGPSYDSTSWTGLDDE